MQPRTRAMATRHKCTHEQQVKRREMQPPLNRVSMTYIQHESLWIITACQDNAVRKIKVSQEVAFARSWRKDLALWLDQPQVVPVPKVCVRVCVCASSP